MHIYIYRYIHSYLQRLFPLQTLRMHPLAYGTSLSEGRMRAAPACSFFSTLSNGKDVSASAHKPGHSVALHALWPCCGVAHVHHLLIPMAWWTGLWNYAGKLRMPGAHVAQKLWIWTPFEGYGTFSVKLLFQPINWKQQHRTRTTSSIGETYHVCIYIYI